MAHEGQPHSLDGVDIRHRRVRVDDVGLHVVEAGPHDGPLVLLLHGFPEGWYGWRKQIPGLARAGLLVWAPDGRGYGLSDKPPSISAYALDELVADVRGLVRAARRPRAHVVGHDWGAAVAWHLAERHPEEVGRLVIINGPHPHVFARTLRTCGRQRRKSVYIAFFQLPLLPEAALRARDHRRLERAMHASSRPGTFSAADMEVYRQAWSMPGALTGMLDWYRAALRAPLRHPHPPHLSLPVSLLWGRRDAFLVPQMAEASAALCTHARLRIFDDATHWLQHEEPEAVNAEIVSFLGA